MLPNRTTFKKHICFTSCNDIDAICSPLKKHLGIDYFSCLYEFIDLEKMQLESVCFKNSARNFEIFYDHNIKKTSYKINIVKTLENYQKHNNQFLLDGHEVAALGHKVYGSHNHLRKLEKINDNEWVRYFFATKSSDPKYLNTYFNNQDLLNHFILYFRSKTNSLLANAKKDILVTEQLVKKDEGNIMENVLGETALVASKEQFLQEIQLTHYPLNTLSGKVVNVPRAEYNCLKLLATGRSAKEIGMILNISSRTVETNFQNAKLRLGCYTRKNLLDIMDKN